MGEGGATGLPFTPRSGKNDGENGTVGGTFEFLLAEWHLPPDYIINNWTDEMLSLMTEKLAERKEREMVAMGIKPETISEEQFFKQAGIKVVKHGD